VAAALWNPSSTQYIHLREIWLFKTTATVDNHAPYRITTRGTPGSTVTPNANNCHGQTKVAPASGALLDLAAYSVQPTIGTPALVRANLPAAIGSGSIWIFNEPYVIAPGEGVAIATPVAVILQASDISFFWDE
jgi:hypothetical protein